MNKKIVSLLLVFAVVLPLTAGTLAWFAGNRLSFPPSFGSSATAYFAGGDGTPDHPYEINSPVHFYNLAWLQYLGYFNMNTDLSNHQVQSHFVLTASFDMGALRSAIPPIGTEQYPFIGHFQGQGHSVRGIRVSNKREDLKVRPAAARFGAHGMLRTADNAQDVRIVGTFGVLGNYTAPGADSGYIDGYLAAHPTFDKEQMSVAGFYLDLLHVGSYSDTTLVGLVAGYVGANLSSVGVYRARFSLAKAAAGIVAFSGDESVVSRYSVVGAYDKALVGWSGDPSAGGGGEINNWGGTVDMRTLARRLTYMYAEGTKTLDAAVGEYSTSDTYRTHITTADVRAKYTYFDETEYQYVTVYKDQPYYWQRTEQWGVSGKSRQPDSMFLCDGTFIPINVNMSAMGIDGLNVDNERERVQTQEPGGTISYKTNTAYMEKQAEELASHNTGYLVGDHVGDYATIRVGMRQLMGGDYGGLNYSFAGTATSGGMYDAGRFSLYTVLPDGRTCRIRDEINENLTYNVGSNTVGTVDSGIFKRYAAVRNQLDEKVFKDSSVYHGVHFEYTPNPWTGGLIAGKWSIHTDPVTGKTTVPTKPDAQGNPVPDYYTSGEGVEYIKGALNFSVANPGYITTVLTGGYSSGKHAMFDLYEVKRADGKITSITRIEKIYSKVDAQGIVTDVSYNAPKDDTYTLAMDIKTLSGDNKLMERAAFYFELPVSAGDYCISYDASNGTDKYNAYITYLDIGANGTETGSSTETAYTLSAVDFVNTDTVPRDAGTATPYYPAYKTVVVTLADVDAQHNADVWYQRADGTQTETGADGTERIATVLYYRAQSVGTVAVSPDNMGQRKDELTLPLTEEEAGT